MARLVVGGPSLLLGRDHDRAGGAEDDPLERVGEVGALDLLVVTPGRQQRGLVDEVLELGADHARTSTDATWSSDTESASGTSRVCTSRMRRRPSRSGGFTTMRRSNRPGPEQGGVEDLGPVGGGQHDHALVAGEPVHLGEDLVERLLALVVTAEVDRPAPGPADRVELVDEDDRRCDLLGLLEQVAHPARADADDHLDELRRRDRQERDRRLAGDRPRQQRLAGARSAGEEHTAGICAPSRRNRSGSLRKSTISMTSALTSSIPATSSKVVRRLVSGSYRRARERPKPPSPPPAAAMPRRNNHTSRPMINSVGTKATRRSRPRRAGRLLARR